MSNYSHAQTNPARCGMGGRDKMGAILSEPDFGVETIPGLLVDDLTDRATGQTDRVARLMVDNAEQRARITLLQDLLHQTQRLAAGLSEQVRTLKGENATARKDCQIVSVPFACGYLLVEAQIEEGESATIDHPGDSGSITPLSVFVNGRWLDVEDLHSVLELDVLRERVSEALA